ncbi:MAG: alpha-amylase family glycosyl hydrolase, partial [Gemmatimonadaceae bacterium]
MLRFLAFVVSHLVQLHRQPQKETPMYRLVSSSLCVALLAWATHLVAQPSNASTASAWKRGAVCYEIFVRSFYDSDADGVGDLNGLIQKLDYINDGSPNTQRDLGASCIWLMPVAESPSYHGYDATNYYRVERDYGSNDDFKRLVAEAHRRGIRVLVDMVLNHASSEHPFFKDALLNPGSPYRDWFRWSATDPKVKGPWGQDVWHRSSSRDEYYYGIFWKGMPDLNYANPAVREEANKIARFWLEEMGADGFRLDAIPYLVEEDGRLAHTPGTHTLLRDYAARVRKVAPNAFTIGEVWDSIGAMLPYYPDQLDAHFAFAVSDAILEAVKTGSTKNLFPAVMRLQRELPADRWSPFLRNHDQTRTLTELGGDMNRARLAATLLLTFPGLPFIYYGEEIGMTGNKPDERLRTPMHWGRGSGAGFTRGAAWEPLHADSLTANVEAQEADTNSLLNLHRRLIHLRASNPALGAGELVPVTANSEAVAAYLRRERGRAVLVIINLGTTPIAAVTLHTVDRVLPPGRSTAKSMLGGLAAAPLRVRSDGRLRDYIPIRSLVPL